MIRAAGPLTDSMTVTIDGTMIATRILEPTAPASGEVVFCHGTPWSSLVWERVARELSRNHRVLLWDMPGYGESEMGTHVAVDLSAQSRRLVALLDRWGLRRPHVVAHDIGAAVALDAHLSRGAEYADLFLWDAVALDPWGSPFFRLVAENAEVFVGLPPVLHSALVRAYVASAVPRGLPESDLDRLVRPWSDSAGQTAFYQQMAALDPADTRPVSERLGLMRCPTRIGWGTEDPWIPVSQAYELQSRLPGQPTVIELAGAGHLTPMEEPVAVTAALLDWLSRPQDGHETSRDSRF